MRQKLTKMLTKAGNTAAQKAVCAASPYRFYQEKEPEAARKKYAITEKR